MVPGVPVALLGVLLSASIAANLATEIPAGVFVDRRGRKPSVAGGAVAMGLSLGLLAVADHLYTLFQAIALFSAGASVFYRGASIRFFEAAGEAAKGRGVALLYLAMALGGFLGLLAGRVPLGGRVGAAQTDTDRAKLSQGVS